MSSTKSPQPGRSKALINGNTVRQCLKPSKAKITLPDLPDELRPIPDPERTLMDKLQDARRRMVQLEDQLFRRTAELAELQAELAQYRRLT